MRIGTLAYGSLIDDPGWEIEQHIVKRLEGVRTPFRVEFARSSNSRNGAPTLVPVADGGAQVKAVILSLDESVELNQAMDMLYRREVNDVGNLKRTYDPNSTRRNAVRIGQLCGQDAFGLDVVLYTMLDANIDPLTPAHLADLAIRSARAKAGKERRDGISYLLSAIRNGIHTPLTEGYKQAILSKTGASSLEDARRQLARQETTITNER